MAFIDISLFLEFFLTLIGIFFLANEMVSTTVERVVVFQQRLTATFMFITVESLFLLPQVSIVNGTSIVTVSLPSSILIPISIIYSAISLIAVSKVFVILYDIMRSRIH